MKKRFAVLLFICVTLFVLLCACVTEEKPKEETETFTVSFDAGNEADIKILSQTVEKGSALSDVPAVTREGYTFGGWYLDLSDESTMLTNSTVIEKDVTYYAKWIENKVETFTVTVVRGDETKEFSVEAGTTINLYSDYTPVGYEAEGWMDQNGKVYGEFDVVEVNGDLTLTAQNYTKVVFIYKKSDDGNSYIVTGLYDATAVELHIPESYRGLPVKEIASGAFAADNYTITSLYVPATIEKIGANAFSGLSKLQELTIPFVGEEEYTLSDSPNEKGFLANLFMSSSSYKSTYKSAYASVYYYYTLDYENGQTDDSTTAQSAEFTAYIPVSLQKVNVLGGILPYRCFGNISLIKEIVLGDNVTAIGDYAFSFITNYADQRYSTSQLTNINIGENSELNYIGTGCFNGLDALVGFYVPKNVEALGKRLFYNLAAFSEITFASDGKLKSIGEYTFANTQLLNVELPEGIETIGQFAFRSCQSLEKANVPSSVTEISVGIFDDCENLETVTFGENSSVTAIPGAMFRSCYKLTTVINIPQNLTEIGVQAFNNTKISEFDFSNITVVGQGAFNATRLTSITFTNVLAEIGSSAFGNCTELVSVYFSDEYGDFTIEALGSGAFVDCKNLVSINLPSSLKSISQKCLSGCGFDEFTIDANIQSIENSAFANSDNLTTVNFADNSQLTSIGQKAFAFCANLKTIVLPSTLAEIGSQAFYQSGLEQIVIPRSVQKIGARAFKNVAISLQLTQSEGIPSGFETDWDENCTVVFADGKGIVTVGDYKGYVTGDGIFYVTGYDNDEITSLVLPDTLMVDGTSYPCEYAPNLFENNRTLKSVTLPVAMTEIPDCFFNNSDVEEVIIPDGGKITKLGDEALRLCRNLTTFNIDTSELTSVGESAMYYCENWRVNEEVKLTKNLTYMGAMAFAYCKFVLYAPEGTSVTEIPNKAFCGNSSSKIYIVVRDYNFENVTSVGYSAFSVVEFENAQLVLPSGLISIGETAFSGTNLTNVTIPDTVTSIGERAFNHCDIELAIVHANSELVIGDQAFYRQDQYTTGGKGRTIQLVIDGTPNYIGYSVIGRNDSGSGIYFTFSGRVLSSKKEKTDDSGNVVTDNNGDTIYVYTVRATELNQNFTVAEQWLYYQYEWDSSNEEYKSTSEPLVNCYFAGQWNSSEWLADNNVAIEAE